MYSYIIGNVTDINSNSIVLECGNIGYMIYVPNPFSYKIGEEYKDTSQPKQRISYSIRSSPIIKHWTHFYISLYPQWNNQSNPIWKENTYSQSGYRRYDKLYYAWAWSTNACLR